MKPWLKTIIWIIIAVAFLIGIIKLMVWCESGDEYYGTVEDILEFESGGFLGNDMYIYQVNGQKYQSSRRYQIGYELCYKRYGSIQGCFRHSED